jgi:hypothetical protein
MRHFMGRESGLMDSAHIHGSRHDPNGVGFVAKELGLGIKYCEVALSAGSAATWQHKIKNAQRAHDVAQRFMNRFRLSGHEAERINHRISHLETLLNELK